MANSRTDDVREVRLEGPGLVVSLIFLAVVIAGSFWAGRWWESRGQVSDAAALDLGLVNEPAIREGAVKEPTDVGETANFFDKVDDSKAEPAREIQDKPRKQVKQPPVAQPQPRKAAVSDGRYFVQVFAGRDEKTATDIYERLESGGYQVQVDSVRDGNQTLYKVRVGGYAERTEAEAVGAKLGSSGYPGAWVTEVKG